MADNFRFRIRGLKLKNIREIEDIEIKFEPNVINPLLIRNGYGKTTMLEMLRWMFVGKILKKKEQIGLSINAILEAVHQSPRLSFNSRF